MAEVVERRRRSRPTRWPSSTIFGVCTSVNPCRPARRGSRPRWPPRSRTRARSRGWRSVVGACVEDRRQRRGDGAAGRGRRAAARRPGQRGDHRIGQLGAARRLRACGDAALDLDHGLLGQASASGASRAAAARDHGPPGPGRTGPVTTRKVTDLSCRRRCSQPAISPARRCREGRSAARITRDHHTPHGSCDPLGVRARRELAVPPHFRRRRLAGGGLVRPGHGGKPAGHRAGRWPRPPFLPALGRVFAVGAARPPSQLPAALCCSRDPVLLVSVSAFRQR